MAREAVLPERVQRAIDERVFPGCVIGIVRRGVRDVLPFGTYTYDTPTAVTEQTIYDLASITKSIPTASLMLELIASGRCRLDDEVTRYLPELRHDHGARLGDLLTYRVAGPRLSTLAATSADELTACILERGFDGPPAERRYTNLPAFLLGLIIERVAEQGLEVLAEERYFGPLAMKHTTFFPSTPEHCAPTEIVDGDVVQGVVHDESARVFSRAHRAPGHAGLFSTVPDLLEFLDALLSGAMPAILSGGSEGLGWQTAEPWFMGTRYGKGSFGKTGFTGTSLALDPSQGIGLVILSNRTYPTRPADAASLTSAVCLFRRDIADIVFAHQ